MRSIAVLFLLAYSLQALSVGDCPKKRWEAIHSHLMGIYQGNVNESEQKLHPQTSGLIPALHQMKDEDITSMALVISELERADVQPGFSLPESQLLFCQALLNTDLTPANKKEISRSLLQAHEEFRDELLDDLTKYRQKLIPLQEKLRAIRASGVRHKLDDGIWVTVNPNSGPIQKLYGASQVALIKASKSEKTPLAHDSIEVMENFLSQYIENRMPPSEQIHEILERFDKEDRLHGTELVKQWYPEIFKKVVSDLASNNYKTRGTLNKTLETLVTRGLSSRENMAQLSPLLLNVAGQKSPGVASAVDSAVRSKGFPQVLELLNSTPSSPARNRLAETIFLGHLSRTIHTAYRMEQGTKPGLIADQVKKDAPKINLALEEAAKAIELFEKSGLKGPVTKEIDLPVLAARLRMMKYSDAGEVGRTPGSTELLATIELYQQVGRMVITQRSGGGSTIPFQEQFAHFGLGGSPQ